MEALTCATSKGGWEDRSDVSCPAYGFRCGIREQSGEEGYSSGDIQLPSYQATLAMCMCMCMTKKVTLRANLF